MKNQKVIFITKGNLFGPIQTGGLQCTQRNYQLLCHIFGAEQVEVGILTEAKGEKTVTPRVHYFQNDGRPTRVYWNYLRMRDRIPASLGRQLAAFVNERQPDLLFLDGSSYCGWTRNLRPSIKKLVFCHNIEKEYIWGWVRHQNWLFLPRFFTVWRNEGRLVQQADYVICLNQRDAHSLERLYGRKANLILPISFSDRFDPVQAAKAPGSGRLLFVGSYFAPNVEGLRWFCRQVLPHIPWSLDVVGKGMEQLRGELASEKVSVIGAVPDLAEYYYRAEAVVMPVLFGSGMKVKTAEALQYGKAIFATREALEGYQVQDLPAVQECNSAEAFIQALTAFRAASSRRVYPENRQRFLELYETSRQEERLRALLEPQTGGNL